MPTLSIKPAPVTKRAVVVMSWPYHASWDLLNSLNSGCYLSGQESQPQVNTTVLLFALAKYIEYKLGATELDAVRSKFTQLDVNVQKNTAILTFRTDPTFSAVRKVVTVASRNFAPAKLFPLYKKYAQLLDVRPEPEHFAHACSEMVKGAKTLQAFITGTVRVPDDGEKTLQSILAEIKPDSPSGGKAPTQVKTEQKVWDELAVGPRLDAFLVHQLLQSMQIESHVRDGNLIPITGNQKWETVRGKVDKDRIERFVEQKLVKLGDKLPPAIRFSAAISGYFTASDLDRLPAKYDKAGLVGLLKKYF